MSLENLLVAQSTIQLRPVFRCNQCGNEAEGSILTLTSPKMAKGGFNPNSLPHTITGTLVPNTHMPDGWASYANGKHHCPKCVKS